jgi:hypothetical protein
MEQRWKRIDRAFHRGEELPPVSLYKVGGLYFVLDGHHRVSVARHHGVGWIDAYMKEFGAGGGVWSERWDREKRPDRTIQRSRPRTRPGASINKASCERKGTYDG